MHQYAGVHACAQARVRVEIRHASPERVRVRAYVRVEILQSIKRTLGKASARIAQAQAREGGNLRVQKRGYTDLLHRLT